MDVASKELSGDKAGEMATDSGNLLHRRQAIRRRNWHADHDQSLSGTLPFGRMSSRVERRRPKSVPSTPTTTNGRFQSRSSVDLTPSLLSMYDHLNTTTNGSQSENSLQNTSNSNNDINSDGHIDNYNETSVKLLAQEEVRSRDMEDNVDSSRVLSVGQKRPLSIGSISSSSSTSLPSYASHKRPNLGDSENIANHGNKPTLLSLANSGNTSMDSLTIGEDWTTLSAQQTDQNDPYYETIKVSACCPPAVRVYSPVNSTGSPDETSLNSSTDDKGDNSPPSQSMQSTFSLKLRNNNNNSTASFSSSDSVSKLSERNVVQSGVLSKDATYYVSYAQRVASEIVETEKTYVHSLGEIIEGYMKHIRHCDRISEAEANQLFGNLEDIYTFNKNLLAEMDECGEDPVEVARCFVDNNEGFDIYTQYCTDYPDSMEVLTNCMLQPSLAEKFKSWQAALGHGLPLGAYLLKPVQRILKYHLLLQNIVKHYESDGPGYETLTTALEQMTHLAHHINEMKRRHEHAVRVQEVQSQMEDYDGPDLSTLGELKLEGSFRLLGAKASRSVFLFEKGILITKRKEEGLFSCKAVIVCSNLMLVESIAKEPLSFHVIPFDNTKLQYTLQARNLEMKRKWCQEIKRLILESYMGKIPDKVKSLVMGLGKTRDEEDLEQGYHLGVDDKKPRRKSANLMDLVKLKKAHRKNEATPPRLAPMDPSQQGNIRSSGSRLQVKQSNKSMSGSRSMDNLSISGSHTLPRTKASSNSESESPANQNGQADPSLATHFTFEESSVEPNQNGQVSRAKSFKIATRANPMTSISLSDNEESTDSESTDEDIHHGNIDEDDVYVRLMYNNNNIDTNGDHSGMSTRGVSMPALNADIDDPDYVTVMLKPKDDVSFLSNSQSSTLDNVRTSGAFDIVTAEDMIADNDLISLSVELPKHQLLSKSNSSSYDNLNKRWSNTSSNPEVEGCVSAVLPPPCQFADHQDEPDALTSGLSKPSGDVATVNPWVKQTAENRDTKTEKSVKCTNRKRHSPLEKSYSFPLGNGDIDRCTSQEKFDWFVYSNKIASDLSEKFCKLKMWDKLNTAKPSTRPKYPGYVAGNGKDDPFTLQQRKTIVRYGTPPRNAFTAETVNQFNSKKKKEGPIAKKFKPKSNKDVMKTRVSLSAAQLWGNLGRGLAKYNKPDKTKVKSKKTQYLSDSKKILEEMESYTENNSSIHSSTSSLNKFPSTSTLTSQKSSEEKFRLPTDFPQNKSNDSWSLNSRESVYSGNFMSKSRDSLSSSTSSLNKVGNVPKVGSEVQDGVQDGFVGSLRTKLSHLTARLTARKQTPNINSTFNPPAQGQYTATFNARYKPQTPTKPEGFVSHLARIYNAREQTSPQRSSPQRITTTPERITNYASVLRKRQLGSPALGSRLATSTTALQPKVRSLPRQLTAPTCGTSDTETCSETTSVHSLDFSKDKSPDRNSDIEFISNSIEQSDSAVSIRSHVSSVDAPLSHSLKRCSSWNSVNSVGSTDSIYERQFSRNLEDTDDNVFRDSAIYSDMDTGYFFTAPNSLPATPRKSIREVVQQIEERSRPKPPEVLDVRKREPGRTIQEKLKSLQASSQYPHRSNHIQEDVEESRPMREVRRSLGSSRSSVDKEETNYSIRYSSGYSGHDDEVKMTRSTGRLDQIDNEVSTLMTMKGWVRQLINKFQTDQ